MTNDELEFLVSQRLDGTLDATESARLDAVLASDAHARSMADDYASLDSALKAQRFNLPDIDPAWLTAQIAGAIDSAEPESLKMFRWVWAGPLAAAAMLMVGLTIGALFLRDEGEPILAARPPLPVTEPTLPVVSVARVELTPLPGTSSRGYANVSISAPAHLTPAVVSALYLHESPWPGRVVIRPAGAVSYGTFD